MTKKISPYKVRFNEEGSNKRIPITINGKPIKKYKPNPEYLAKLKKKIENQGYIVYGHSVNRANKLFFQIQKGSIKEWRSVKSLGIVH